MNKDTKTRTELDEEAEGGEEEMPTAEDLGVAGVQSNAGAVLRPVPHIRRITQ